MHAAWNAIIQTVFDRLSSGSQAPLWIGESGLLVAATLVILAVISARTLVASGAISPARVRAKVA
jgi:hypothetical protein